MNKCSAKIELQNDLLTNSGLNPEQVEAFLAQTKIQSFSAGHRLAEQGDKIDKWFWVASGLLRSVYQDEEGKTFSKEFFWEGDFLLPFTPFIEKSPLTYSIECCEQSELAVFSFQQLELLSKSS